MNPLLKWMGSKRWLAHKLYDMYERNKLTSICEPFCGSCAFSFYAQPETAYLMDVNIPLISFYRNIKKGFDMIGVRTDTDKDTFLEYRKEFNRYIDEPHIFNLSKRPSQLFYYLNLYGYKGLYRVNKSGHYNAPYYYRTKKYPDVNFSLYKQCLEEWYFWNYTWDFFGFSFMENFIDQLETDCLIYVDPPYDTLYNNYDSSGFTYQDQVILSDILESMDRPIIVTNSPTDRMIELYTSRGYTIEIVPCVDTVSHYGAKKEKRMEMIATRGLD